MRANENDITLHLMNLCYHCENNRNCTTEEACKACWAEMEDLNFKKDETEGINELLRAYYE